MTTTVIVGIVCSVISILITYMVTTMVDRKYLKALVNEVMVNHERQMHQEKMTSLIEQHENTCLARLDFVTIKTALAFLVAKQPGGDPKALGLLN